MTTDAVTTQLAERRLTLGIDPEIADRYPDCRTAVVLALGVDNSRPWTRTESELAALETEVADGRRAMPGEDHPAIAAWHSLLRSFGTNPRRMRPSVDALGRRLAKSGRLPRISPLVDTCNLVSLRYTLPTGGYDLDHIRHGFTLRYARPGDVHIPLGQPDVRETPLPGEIVYADGGQVLTRHWNHRDADNTKVTEATVDAVLFLEGISPAIGPEVLERAQRELADRVAPYAASVTLHAFDPARETTVAWSPTR
ncbi:phenylalanine--tRNA ligase beta subunit-related protein [Streptomyces sp. NPDC045431]|uniref:B3/B4 domain-containing protein n=1 Tax=Streptomyces sp. NPDC045431 TaxID=3155613 RepID=UPI0033C84CCC